MDGEGAENCGGGEDFTAACWLLEDEATSSCEVGCVLRSCFACWAEVVSKRRGFRVD